MAHGAGSLGLLLAMEWGGVLHHSMVPEASKAVYRYGEPSQARGCQASMYNVRKQCLYVKGLQKPSYIGSSPTKFPLIKKPIETTDLHHACIFL